MRRSEGRARAKRGLRVGTVVIVLSGLAGMVVPWAGAWSQRSLSAPLSPHAAGSVARVCPTAARSDHGRSAGGTSPTLLHRVQHCTVSSLGAPQNLTAGGTSTSQIALTWQAGTGTIHHYEVWRRRAAEELLLATTSSTTLTDSNLPATTAYVYQVRAVDSNGGVSPFSNASLGATVMFQEAIQQFVTTVKAQHLTELRPAIDAVRSCAGLPGAAWGPAPQVGGVILAADVQALRTQLTPALIALGLLATWTDDPLVPQSTVIKKTHVQELRNAVQ